MQKMAVAVNYQPPDVSLNIQVIHNQAQLKYYIITLHTDYLPVLYQVKIVWITF
jgi:hypothetical protein